MPLVSVICICYNHKDYVVEALESVRCQSYKEIELIVVDDASTDGSRDLIRNYSRVYPEVKSILLETNQGNCTAFNQGLKLARGKYLIDLAADDLLHIDRVSVGVERLESLGPTFGVHYCDVLKLDSGGKKLGDHRTSAFFDPVPEGYLFIQLLERYFINPVSMMFSAEMIRELDGYDETLAYEDFDLWVRSSKKYKYCFTPEILVSKRVLKSSHGYRQYQIGSSIPASTYKVCCKALELSEEPDEYNALLQRINYEAKKTLQAFNLPVFFKYLVLRLKVKGRIKLLTV